MRSPLSSRNSRFANCTSQQFLRAPPRAPYQTSTQTHSTSHLLWLILLGMSRSMTCTPHARAT